MLSSSKHGVTPAPKCYFTSSTLPGFINHEQPPTKKRPFSTVLDQTLSHTLNVLIPQEVAENFQRILTNDDIGTLRYLVVYMKLSEVIEGEFFNDYIKTGNILMLSEGRPRIDHTFSLIDGILRLEVDKPTFERMGLEGRAIPDEGRKHAKTRFVIELNLRLPCMVSGKTGFQRVVWALKNVLNDRLHWLFYDLKGPNNGCGPIANYQPKVKEVKPRINAARDVKIPNLTLQFEDNDYEAAIERLEWLTLAFASSTRIRQDDRVDVYLSRYRVPSGINEAEHVSESKVQDLIVYHWHAFIPAMFIQKVLLNALKASDAEWFAVSANAFDGKSYTFLQVKDCTMTWEYQE